MNKKAFVTTLDDNFYYPFCYMISSLLTNTDMSDNDFIIIDIGLSPELRDNISKIFPWIRFHDFSKNDYNFTINGKDLCLEKISQINKTNIFKNYYKLEILNIEGYEQLCHIDSDCLVINDLSQVFNYNKKPFYACRIDSRNVFYVSVGVMVVNTNMIQSDYFYHKLKNSIPYYGGKFGGMKIGESDQSLFNEILIDYFGEIPSKFNFRSFENNIDDSTTVVIHFTHKVKPWDKSEYNLLKSNKDIDNFSRKVDIWNRYSDYVTLIPGLL